MPHDSQATGAIWIDPATTAGVRVGSAVELWIWKHSMPGSSTFCSLVIIALGIPLIGCDGGSSSVTDLPDPTRFDDQFPTVPSASEVPGVPSAPTDATPPIAPDSSSSADAIAPVPADTGMAESREVDIDCRFTLPCVWTSADGTLSVSIDRIVQQEPGSGLRSSEIGTHVTVMSTRDTSISFLDRRLAYETLVVTDDGRVYGRSVGTQFVTYDESTFGLDPVESVDLTAGTAVRLQTRIVGSSGASGSHSSYARMQLVLKEQGIFDLFPSFRDLPIENPASAQRLVVDPGTTGRPGEAVDCGGRLNCTWVAADADRSITVVASGPSIGSSNGLVVEFSLLSGVDYRVDELTEIEALGNDGAEFGMGTGEASVSGGRSDARIQWAFGGYEILFGGVRLSAYVSFREDIFPSATGVSRFAFQLRSGSAIDTPEFLNLPGFPQR